MKDHVADLYRALVNGGYNVDDLGGSIDGFREAMSDSVMRKEFYDWVGRRGNFRLPDYDAYESALASTYDGLTSEVTAEEGKENTESINQFLEKRDTLYTGLQDYNTGIVSGAEQRRREAAAAEAEAQAEATRQRLREEGTIDRMKEAEKEARQNKRKGFWNMFGSAPAQTSFLTSPGDRQRLAQISEENAQKSIAEYSQNKLLQEKLDVALDMARAGDNQDGLRGVENFGLGLWDSATRLSTWDFGYSDIVNNLTLQQIVEKWENDPSSLTATEQKVLEGIGMATAVQELYSDQVGIGYNVGQSLPESASFMVGMALNPASGLGKSLARNAVRTYGRNSIAKNLARIGGDIAETAIMTATTGAGRVAADALERINGSSTYEIGENGVIMYGGQKDQETVGNAVIKAIGSNFIENYSEALGEYFDPLLGMSRKVAAGGLRKMNLNKWADALSDVQPSQMTASIRSLREKTKFGGIFGEVMEEEIGMALNAISGVGDYTFSKEKADKEGKQWIFDLENQLTTVLSCAIMSGTLNGVEQVSNVAARRRMEKNAKNAEQSAANAFGEQFAELRESIDQASPEGMVDVLRDVYMNQDYSLEQKRKLAEYAAARLQMQYYNAADAKARREVNKTQQGVLDAYEAGRHAQLPTYYNIEQEYRNSEEAINASENAENIWAAIETLNRAPLEEHDMIINDFTEEEQQLIRQYRYNAARVLGAVNSRAEQAEDLIDEYRGQIAPFTKPDGTVTTAILGDNVVFVMEQNENGDAVVHTNDGRKIFAKTRDLEHVETHNAEDLIERFRQSTNEAMDIETENAFEHHPKTQAPQVGLQLQSPEGEVVITAVNDNMVEIVPAVYKDGQVQPKEGSEPRTITVDDAYAWQDDYFLSMDADQAYANAMAEASNVSAETTENEGTPSEQIEQSVSEEVADGQNIENQPTEEVAESVAPAAPQTARERVPKDEDGNPIYEQTDADTAWDAIVEETEGDTEMAQRVAVDMLEDKKAALAKLQNGKPKKGATVAEKIANEKKHQEAIAKAEADVKAWERIAQVNIIRQQKAELERAAAEKAEAEQRRAEEARILAEQEEQARIEREQLNGVPDMVDDTPQDARARGFRRVNGHKVDRQGAVPSLQGKEVGVKFANDMIANGRVAVIEAETLQPSHLQGQRNPAHFIDEAQPKERNDEASIASARQIASNIRPEEITTSVTAYTGAPTVNMRGEAIQGNSRSDALRVMWAEHPDQAEKYKQYLIDHAEEFGLNAEDVAAMQHPVLVNMLDVNDADAINLGQYVAQDTESGGTERIKPKNVARKMGSDIRSYANILLRSSDEEASFSELVDRNGVEVLKWMNTKGYITPTQYASAFDSKGNLTAEAKNDLRGILYQSIFQGGNTQLEEQFNAMPAKAQKAILATAYRDYDSPESERMVGEIQSSIRAYYALSHNRAFVDAKNYTEAKEAMLVWSRQYQMDDVTGESFLPSENFSNFALELAVRYKGNTQSATQNLFNELFDLIQGTKEASLFEEADNRPRTLAEAIKETLNIDYNGQNGSNALVGDDTSSQEGRQGSTGDSASGELSQNNESTADDRGRAAGDSDTRAEETGGISEVENLSDGYILEEGEKDSIDKATISQLKNLQRTIKANLAIIDRIEKSGKMTEELVARRKRDTAWLKSIEDSLSRKEQIKEKNKWGVKSGNHPVPLDTVKKMFAEWNENADIQALFDRVLGTFEKLGVNITFEDNIGSGKTQGWFAIGENRVKLPTHMIYSNRLSNQSKASVMVHEMIHGVTQYVLYAAKLSEDSRRKQGINLSEGMITAAEQLNEIYDIIKKDKRFKGQYGIEDVHEMVSELAEPEFRALLKATTIWDRIVEAIRNILGLNVENNALDGVSKALDYIIDNYDADLYRKVSAKARRKATANVFDMAEDVLAERELQAKPVLRGESDENLRFRDGAPFFSNAERAVENIKQQKATPEQWLAMIKKDGGLKAGEDKWMGLSDWLNEQKTQGVKTLTKDEVLAFIRENQIEIEKVEYVDNPIGFDELKEEYESMLRGEGYDAAHEAMVDRFGDDFDIAFDDLGGELVVANEEAAAALLGSGNIINHTRLDYTTAGLENKREIALVVPTIEPWNQGDEIHFGDAGDGRAVAWVRFGETTDADGNRVLVIDEVQSKRHDEGRAKGYKQDVSSRTEAYRKFQDIESSLANKHGDEFYHLESDEEIKDFVGEEDFEVYASIRDEYIEARRFVRENNSLVPDAPFDKNYHELVMKRMLRYAAENGFDKVAWTKGAQQAQRYNLAKRYDYFEREDNPNEEGRRFVFASHANADVFRVNDEGVVIGASIEEAKGKTLASVVGSELAEQMMSLENGDIIDKKDIVVGGEGMKGYYDEMIPRFMNKYTKKWGTKVGEVTLPKVEEAGRTMWSVDVTPEMRESVMQGQPMFREGMGAISDREVSYENDPIAKFMGKPRYYGKRAAAFAERERRRMENAAKEAAEMLGIEAEIVTDASTLQGRKAKAKGWYDIINKKVVVVVPNHVSMGDAVRTVLHEGIAHHGLRELFGDGFDAMLDNVYNNVSPELKARIDAIAERTGVSKSVATEEYMASLAETTNFEEAQRRGWWQQIKSYFVDMLRKLSMPGLRLKEEITDNELRYLLWRSYKNLVEPNSYLKPLGYAEDVVKQKELKVGEYAEKAPATPMAADTSEAEEWAAVTMQRIEELEAQAAQLENEIAEMEADRDSDDASRYEVWEQQLEPLRKQMEDVYAELEGLYSLEAEAEDMSMASEDAIRYRLVDDPADIERLESEPTIKAYRAMQVIDGELYPPMSAVVDGKLREPITLGQWEQSEERPDLADDKGRFKLDKGNKKSLKAAYNPYFHSSSTPLNDQFSEAQDRDNLVTVEVEVPVSEADGTSGYKAEKAKDAVGTHQWKAGIIQGQLTGKREVFLTRWDKPMRIVPESEVADVIVEMFDGKDIVMPSNVVTPQLRKELEARGITFVETDNQGKLVEGENKGKHYSKVYGKKAENGLRYREGDDTKLMDALADAYASGDAAAIQDAVNDIMDAIRLDDADPSIGNLDWEKVESYNGTDPRLLAAQYIVRAQHHLYLDEDYDTEYIKTGIKTVDAPVNETAEEDVSSYTNDLKNEQKEAQRQFEERVERSQNNSAKGVWLWNGLMSVEEIQERHQSLIDEFENLLSTHQFDKAADKLGEIRAWQNAAKRHIDNPYSETPYVGEDILIAEIERESAALGVPVRIARSVDELPDDAETRKRAEDGSLKGVYSTRDGEVVVYLPNTENANDAKRTILHEIVGHKGLRSLIGEQRYDKAMLQLMYMLPADVRDAVLRRAERHGWNAAIAMDEYLAEQAERDVQPTWWGKVNAKIRALLRNLGFDVKLTDADVTYLLWRSRKKLQGDSLNDMAVNAILKQAARKSSEADAWNEQAFKDAEMRDFEQGAMQTLRNRIGDAQNEYDSTMKSMAFKQRESWQDSMRSLKVFMDILEKESGKKIADFENAYMYENAMSSANLMEMQMFRHDVYGRLLKAIHELMESGAKYEEVVDYMMAKHGLERNEKMARKRAEKEAEGDAAKEAELYAKYREEDLSGLTALTGVDNVADAEVAAMQMVANFEAAHNTSLLWNETRACTQTILNISHDAGILSDEVYGELWNQYEYYIPLRGFDETTAEEMYTYVGDNKSPYNAPIKIAKGRKSKADDPIATIATMAESAIVEANRNRLKQRFLYMVERHRTELASVSSVWVEKDPVTGDCVARFANIPNDATPEEAAQAQKAFEERMEQLHEQEPERYYKASEKPNIPYRVEKKSNEHEHQIIVKRGGKDVVITINGDPRVAQAINGLTNPEAVEGFSKFAGKVNRFLSANFTTRNPAFVVSNFVRDGFYTNSMVWVKEGPAYARRYNQNWVKATKLLPSLVSKYKKYESGDKSALDMSDPVERAFYEFMIHGGETGYTVINSVEDYKGIVSGDLRAMQGGVVGNAKKAMQAVGNMVDTFGRWAEDTSRFAAYLTSRQMGRTVTKSIWDAKEISVNFNKKGSGRKMTQHDKGLNSLLGWMSQQGRNLYVFWNAGVQGLTNFGKAAKEHPGKMAGLVGAYFGLGMLVAAVFGGQDDDDDYWNLPEYVRRNNICHRVGDKWITLPLPIEIRAIYGMGELAMSWIAGKEDPKKIGMKIVRQVSQVLPIDMMAEGGGLMAFIPSWFKPIAEVYVNTDWTGMPIYRKRTPFNEYDPTWMLAFKSTSPELVAISRAINEATNENLPSGKENKYDRGWADSDYFNNAEAWEHVVEGYLGGLATTFNQTKKSVMALWNKNLREMRNIPVISRFVKSTPENEKNTLRNDYFEAKDEVDKLRAQRGRFRKESKNIDKSLTEEQLEDVLESLTEMEGMVNATISKWDELEKNRKSLEQILKEDPEKKITIKGKEWKVSDLLDGVTKEMITLVEAYRME